MMFCNSQCSLRMQNTSLRCHARHCGLSYLMWKGVVNVICMLHWCSKSSLSASSAGKDCDCMLGEQTSVSDDISLGPLYYPGWDAWACTIKTSLSLYIHLSPTPPSVLLINIRRCLCVCGFLDPASVALYGSDMLSTSYYSHKKKVCTLLDAV